MSQQLSVNTTILSFAFSGMLGARRPAYGTVPAQPSAVPKKR